MLIAQKKINHFTDLIAWQEAHKLVLTIYALSASFPKEEVYGLTSQIRRAAVSISSNIAEGFGRKGTKDKLQFFKFSVGSLLEVENQLIIAKDLNYISKDQLAATYHQTRTTNKILCGLINKLIES